MAEQRSQEWYNERKGRFTGSQIHKLMGVRGLGQTGETYIFEVVYNSLFDDLEENFTSYDMQVGVEREPLAFKKLSQILGQRFIKIEKCGFFPYLEYGGASPDGVGEKAVIEIKCPKANTFFNVVKNNYVDPKYYDQMQMEMLAANKELCYYFNYFIDTNGKEFWHLIEVKRDEKRINEIKDRLILANALAEKFKKELLQNIQF